MSMQEQACALIEKIPSYKLGYVIAYLQGMMADDEAEDDLFCERMYQDYLNDPDPEKDELVSEEEAARILGVTL